jgi:uncharacterized protein (TIGR03437 family)
MRNRLSSSAIAVLALAFPIAALADFSNTQTISSGGYVNLTNGATASSGADLLFSGTSITPQGSAAIYNLGALGQEASVEYGSLTSGSLSFFKYTTTPISGTSLVAGEIFLVQGNLGYYTKVWITAVSSSSLSLQYDTFGAPAGGNTPTITAVDDAGSYTPTIAQGSMFVVKGNNLSGSGYQQTGYPLPQSFMGSSIAFTPLTGGSPTAAYIVYLYNEGGVNQLAAILPSTIATGFYNVTVTYNGATSSGLSVQVAAQKPAFLTQDSTGSGLALVQNYVSATEYDINRFTTEVLNGSNISPAHPGQTLIAWMTGLGAVAGGDNIASAGYNFAANGVNIQVIVGGVSITPAYAGRAPGLSAIDQVDFTLPANIPTGCTISFQLSENGVVSLPTFISIAPAGSNACVQPGYTTSQLQSFDQGFTVNYGSFEMVQTSENLAGQTTSSSSASGGFFQYTGFELAAIPPQLVSGYTIPTGCNVIQITPASQVGTGTGTGTGTGLGTGTGSGSGVYVGGTGIFLDAGKVTLTGPTGSGLNNTPFTETANTYSLGIGGTGSGVNGNLVGGTYTLTGAGGTGVGPFSTSLNLPGFLAVAGGLPSVVNRSSGLTINWTGGNASDIVLVAGVAATIANDFETGAEFYCYTNAGAKTLSISSSILNQLPAISAAQIASFSGVASLSIVSLASPLTGSGLFSAPLTAGGTINNASFSGAVEIIAEPVYQ